jgi:formylmethanofuran dehydrogenase subunit E
MGRREDMRSLADDLEAAEQFHGHLCSGMVLGVRMARLALAELGIREPLEYRDLIVYVEMDRCASDAVSVVAGCTLGRRRLKFVDYGKMAATFVDLATGQAVRVAAGGETLSPADGEDVVAFWREIPDSSIFALQRVNVAVPPEDLPGRSSRRIRCEACGERIFDGRDECVGGRTLCRPCAGSGAYYDVLL